MKKSAMVLLLGLAVAGAGSAKEQAADGTARKDAAVAPAAQTSPNRAKLANDAVKGKVNPNAGTEGTADPYKVPLLRDARPLN
jgi:hypothetical protein